MSSLPTKDYYHILGLAKNAEDVVIRAVFKVLAQRYHPDKWLREREYANLRMAEVNEAYQHLSKYNHVMLVEPIDFYQVLGVLNHVDDQLIHTAYEALVKKYRKEPARLALIEEAYATLSQPRQRKFYDFHLGHPVFHQSSGLNLGKIYLAYHVTFYLIIVVIWILVVVL